jgi:hypothetical protein
MLLTLRYHVVIYILVIKSETEIALVFKHCYMKGYRGPGCKTSCIVNIDIQ